MEMSRNVTTAHTLARLTTFWNHCFHICYAAQVALWGITSVVLYFLLYLLEEPILESSKQGHWYFIVPIAIAFVFSIVHGTFTSHFWDLLGVKAKSIKK